MGAILHRDASGRSGAVRAWLYLVAALVVAMVAVGGATRLTGSGLSITEWRPVTGVVPPLSEADWASEFAKYRDTPQYAVLNRGMGLPAFKTLYAWEWGHRLLGRVLALAFFGPLLVFWWRGMIGRRLGLGLLALGVLGGFQGAIGWIMVASGLQPGMTAVAPLKLALHLTTASLILAGLVWLAAGESAAVAPTAGRLRATALALPALVLAQIFLGGLVAGSHAGLVYNTWPDMDGALAPPLRSLFAAEPWIENFVDNHALVQLDHRLAAYLVVLVSLVHALDARFGAADAGCARRAAGVAGLALAQAGLGVATLLLAVPLWAALAHQVLAMALLTMATVHARHSYGVVAAVAPSAGPILGFERLVGPGV